MKMKIRNLIVIGLVTLIMAAGCIDNQPSALRYDAEKLYHTAEDKFENFMRTSQTGRREKILKLLVIDYDTLVNFSFYALNELAESDNKTEIMQIRELAYKGSLRLSQLLYAQKKYFESTTTLERLLAKSNLAGVPLVQVNLNLGQSLHASGQFDSAMIVYQNSLSKFFPPIDENGELIFKLFNLPLHIYEIYYKTSVKEDSDTIFEQIENYYLKLLEREIDSTISNACYSNLSILYGYQSKYEKQIEVLSNIRDESSDKSSRIKTRIADIYSQKLSQYDKALKILEEQLSYVDIEDSLLYPSLLFRKSSIYFAQGKSTYSRQILVDIKRTYPGFYRRTPAVQQLMARSFEKDNNWNRAETEYNILVEKYPYSTQSLATHIYLTNYYESIGRTALSTSWLRQTEKLSKDMIKSGKGTLLEVRGILLLADSYRSNGKFKQSAEKFLEIFQKFPEFNEGKQGLGSAIKIYIENLDDTKKADSLKIVLKNSLSSIKESLAN